ncbi:MAG: YggS family pyridoxal phosphate enzyme [Candidatus Omnitrophica bacterium]|nr:YggS family pyridoxal phosphate enzyme [Candidatus Omnitrophota bacterium]
MLAENLRRVRERMQAACHRAGRDPSSVRLIAVTKTVPAERIQQAMALGVADIGENLVQEAREKRRMLGRAPQASSLVAPPVRWHLIGHLQRNKAKYAVELFDVIHSVDSHELAEELERQACRGKRPSAVRGSGLWARGNALSPTEVFPEAPNPQPPTPNNLELFSRLREPLEVLIQVNVSGEATKSGCQPEEAGKLAETVGRLAHLRLIGLMTIPPFDPDPEQARPHFRRLRELRDELQALRPRSSSHPITQSLKLSIGMSHDFEIAIEEGADLVRIGTAIFGERAP